MLKKLYGEERKMTCGEAEKSDEAAVLEGESRNDDIPRDVFKSKLERRKDFEFDYWTYILVYWLQSCCCCLLSCCKSRWLRQRIDSYQKFNVAQERLNKEQDIQHLIKMNRITRLIHKVRFLPHQRRAFVGYSHKYVVTALDISNAPIKQDAQKN